jgi:protein-S-isoprenylcysteine O-methyltransferase Ste14
MKINNKSAVPWIFIFFCLLIEFVHVYFYLYTMRYLPQARKVSGKINIQGTALLLLIFMSQSPQSVQWWLSIIQKVYKFTFCRRLCASFVFVGFRRSCRLRKLNNKSAVPWIFIFFCLLIEFVHVYFYLYTMRYLPQARKVSGHVFVCLSSGVHFAWWLSIIQKVYNFTFCRRLCASFVFMGFRRSCRLRKLWCLQR